jgi:hypothetical protein
MGLPRKESPRGSTRRRVALWSALAVGGFLPSVGCQVEYAGMTLPSGRYMHDDVQYFPSGPDFPWANTQAATQRARMRAMGIEPPPPPGAVPPAMGAESPAQLGGGRPTDVNVAPTPPVPGLPGGPPAAMPPGGGVVPMPTVPPGVPAPGGAAPPGGAANVPPPDNQQGGNPPGF